jgi:hypothetical protein
MLVKMKADFALQWLDYLGVTIYNNGEQILKYEGDPKYEIKPLEAGIEVGEELGEEEDEHEYIEMSYQDMMKLGYVVFPDNKILWQPRQRCSYVIKRKTKNSFGLTYEAYRKAKSQSGLIIQHDAVNRRFRIVGNNVLPDEYLNINSGIGPWIIYDEDAPHVFVPRKKKMPSLMEMRALSTNNMFGHGGKKDVDFQPIYEVPLILTAEKYIVCMPRESICQRVLVSGKSRRGKSTFVNAVATQIFYQWQDRIGWMIDPQNQFYDISNTQEFDGFNKVLKWINLGPTPLPAVQLYLASRNTIKHPNPNISLTLCQDYYEFLNKFDFYAYGMKDWQIPGSKRYLTSYFSEIKNISSTKELKDFFYEEIPDILKDKNAQSMVHKWVSTFEVIFKERFTSNMYINEKTATHELEIVYSDGRTISGHPFIMLMEAGAVPVINTSMVPNKSCMEEKLRKRHFWIADEMQAIYEEGSGKSKDQCSLAFETLFRQGGFNEIGFIGNTQSLEKLPREMVKNATHICCVELQSPKERKIIQEIYQLPKEVTDQLGNLKTQEIMIFTSADTPFIVYDRWGRRTVVHDKKWFRGKIIPPINYHKSPK